MFGRCGTSTFNGLDRFFRNVIFVADEDPFMQSAPRTGKRCSWVNEDDPLLLEYHDREWGVPVHSDRKHFEGLVLSGAQAGLNWSLVLKKREGYRRAFDKFDPQKVARYSEKQIQTLLGDAEIIRNRMKIEGAVRNARALLKVQEEFGDFDSYCWRFVGGRPKLNRWKTTREIPASSPESETFSKDLKRRGFSFVGPTVIYAYMQAIGMVNDHVVDCFRHGQISKANREQSVAQVPVKERDRRGQGKTALSWQ
jgi:DNA-3-methyladenine glycosylase I